ncbi:MAG TPA: copper amine oxidase N-terminal domain-containing protein [Metabacillus sp.]|nr:copper amine oxidase N-terminal domain-containing protein [Metabacillus sp.]
MKKSASLFAATSILLTFSVASAGSAKLQVNDRSNIVFNINGTVKPLPAGYKVLDYQDRTYVPTRFVAEQLGATVGYNNNVITINSKSQLDKTIDVTKKDIENLKTYTKIMEHYRKLTVLGDMLSSYFNYMNHAESGIRINNYTAANNLLDEKFLPIVKSLSESAQESQAFEEELIKQGTIQPTVDVLSNYFQAAKLYDEANTQFFEYVKTKDLKYAYSYFDKAQKAYNICLDGQKLAHNNYIKFYQKIQAY